MVIYERNAGLHASVRRRGFFSGSVFSSCPSVVFPWIAVLAVSTALGGAALAGEAEVFLHDGRTLMAAIDPQTDADHLWLRYEGQSMTIRRPISWHRVTGITIDGRRYGKDAVRQAAMAHAEPEAAPSARAVGKTVLPVNGSIVHSQRQDKPHHGTMADWARAGLGLQPRVVSARATAYVANWDADIEPDGLVVEVAPMAADGQVVAVDGTVDVQLFEIPRFSDSRRVPHSRQGRWVRTFSAETLQRGGAVFRLPFQAGNPSLNDDVSIRGLVLVRLNVAGHGTFDVSLPDVRLRPYSAVRDDLQQTTGSRFLPYERLGTGR